MNEEPTPTASFQTMIALHGVRRQEQRERIMIARIAELEAAETGLERRLAAARAVLPMLEASPSELRLLAGEMTAQEMRTVRAVTGAIATKLRKALSDTE